MFDAQTMSMQGATSTVLLSPWFPRGGDYGVFTLEALKMSETGSSLILSVQLIHKNASEAGEGNSVGSAFTRAGDAQGRVSSDITNGFKELVRYQFTLARSGGSGTNWATFRMLAPVWYDTV